jgi:hypothetical protein
MVPRVINRVSEIFTTLGLLELLSEIQRFIIWESGLQKGYIHCVLNYHLAVGLLQHAGTIRTSL